MFACAATDDFSRARIDQMIDLHHPLAVLPSRMLWQETEAAVAHRFVRKAHESVAMPDLDLFGEKVQRQAIEPIIGHLKADHRMDGCHLKGEYGDRLHAVLCAAGYNLKWLLRMIAKKGGPSCMCFFAPEKRHRLVGVADGIGVGGGC